MLKSHLPRIISRSPALVTAAVQTTAARIVGGAQKRSRVRTGAMRAGWQMKVLNPYETMVYNMVTYTIYNEYGTYKMSAQPMLRPSVEEVRMEFYGEVIEAWKV